MHLNGFPFRTCSSTQISRLPFFLFWFFFCSTLRRYLHQSFLAKANTVRSRVLCPVSSVLCPGSRFRFGLGLGLGLGLGSGSACSGLGSNYDDIGDSRRHPIPSGLTNEFRALAPCDLKGFPRTETQTDWSTEVHKTKDHRIEHTLLFCNESFECNTIIVCYIYDILERGDNMPGPLPSAVPIFHTTCIPISIYPRSWQTRGTKRKNKKNCE